MEEGRPQYTEASKWDFASFVLIVFGLYKIRNGKYSQQFTEPLWF